MIVHAATCRTFVAVRRRAPRARGIIQLLGDAELRREAVRALAALTTLAAWAALALVLGS